SFHDVSPYEILGQSVSEDESEKIVLGVEKGGQDEGQAGPDLNTQTKGQTGSNTGAQAEGQAGSNPDETFEGQAGSNPDETSEGQAGPDPSNAEARVQSTSSLVVHAGSDREHMDIDVANVSLQPSTEQLYEGFTAMIYPNIQENLKIVVDELMLLEEPASSSGTLSSLQHLSRDFTFGDQFFSDKPLDADKIAEIEVESMVNVPIQQAMSSIPLITSHIIDLTSRPEKKGRESPKTPPGSPSHQPPPPPLPAGPSGTSRAPRASGSQVTPPLPPPTSTNQDSSSTGSAAPSPAKMAATTKHQAWSTPDVTLQPIVSLTPEDLDMDKAMGLDEQAQLSDEEDIGSAYILTVNLRQGWWKPFEEERPTTLEPAWSIRSSDVPVPPNNWASTLASNYSPPPEDSLLAQTGDITTFMDWFCKRRGITKLKPQDLEGPAYEIVKVFHLDVIHLQYQMEECHKLLTDSVDDPILRHNVSKPLPLGGLPGQVTIQSDFFFNKDLKYLRYGSKGRRHLNHLPPKDKKILTMAVNQWTRQLVIRQRVEDFQLGIESYQTQVNLTKPQWTATGFEYKHNYTVIKSSRAVIFWDKYGVQMMMRFNEIHKFSDGTLQQIIEALDYRVKEFRINMMNPEAFEDTENLPQPGELCWRTVREGDYRLLKRND
nr:hypothetical protein [Tanacetum cinerariifolium]